MTRLIILSVSVTLFSAAACSEATDLTSTSPKPVASIGSKGEPNTMRAVHRRATTEEASPAAPAQRSEPRSEEALVEAVARALSARKLEDLQARTTLEFAADLRRMHDLDPATFWIRGSAFVQNVKSGFEVLHRQEDTSDQWNIVVRFGNGQEERMTFTRDGGKLRFVDL